MTQHHPSEATKLYYAVVLKKAIEAYHKSGLKVSSYFQITNALKSATKLTGRPYGRGKAAQQLAIGDLEKWIEAAYQQIERR